MKRLPVLLLMVFPLATAIAADGQPTDAQIDTAFAKADADKNGTGEPPGGGEEVRNQDEDVRESKSGQGRLTRQEGVRRRNWYQFTAADPDKDRTLDWKEAQKAGIENKKVFDASDPDRDGTLDLAEYLAALTAQAK